MIQPQSSDQEQCHISAEASFTPPSTVTYSIFPSFCPPVSHSVGAFKRRKMVLLQGMSMLIWKEEEDFLFCFFSLRLTFSNTDNVSVITLSRDVMKWNQRILSQIPIVVCHVSHNSLLTHQKDIYTNTHTFGSALFSLRNFISVIYEDLSNTVPLSPVHLNLMVIEYCGF